MSLHWPELQLQPHVFMSLPPHQMPSPSLKRACKRYVTAMNQLNKQICDLNADALEQEMMQCRTHSELRDLVLQTKRVPFVSMNVHTLSSQLPRLLVLERAAQCVSLLRDVLDEWEDGNHAQGVEHGGTDGNAQTGLHAGGNEEVAETFSVFAMAPTSTWAASLM